MQSGPVPVPALPTVRTLHDVPAQPVRFVSMYEKTAKLYPRALKGGRFNRLRWAMVALTQVLFLGLPWLQWHGRQAVLFDLDTPRFYVFGLVLQPQELIFLAGLLVLAALGLFFVTAVAGRLWCGYACPQTVYSEIFQWLEWKTEGDRQVRMRRDAAPCSMDKLRRKAAKHTLWWLVSLLAGATFVGYFMPVRQLGTALAQAGVVSWPVFWLLFYAGMLYGHAGFMREQICKYMCPYARFQSTLIDRDSLVIAYDTARGEPRGSRPRHTDPAAVGLGSCTDCTLCVQVCPTGIDIRNGLQNECIGCAACIDVCDDVMAKMGYPAGLIRYATSRGVDEQLTRAQMLRRVARPRVWVYSALLLAAGGAIAAGLWWRAPLSMDVIRDRGVMARRGDDGRLENLYRLQLMNRTEHVTPVRLSAQGLPGLRVDDLGDLRERAPLQLRPGEIRSVTLRLSLPAEAAQALSPGAQSIVLEAAMGDAGAAVVREHTTFLVPR